MLENTSPQLIHELQAIADHFVHRGKITGMKSFGNGNINDTFLVTLDDPDQTSFVLQKINTHVFKNPQGVMQNMWSLTEHIYHKLRNKPLDRRWEMPRVLLTKGGKDHLDQGDGSYWRAISYIEFSESFDTLNNAHQAQEVGYALGTFHHLISDLATDNLIDTLEGFHITPNYLKHYQEVLAETTVNASEEVQFCLNFVRDRADWCDVLEQAKASGKLPLRLMHGDPKVNNIMFDRGTQLAVSVIDLDTVKPGLIHYDIGDCLRSGCNPLGEETGDWRSVYFDLNLCQHLLEGYLSVAKAFLTKNDYLYLFDAIRLIAFELGLRFFTDYLAGNVYFKVKYPDHNLV
ncbi:MAG: phosphotransferase enzyme family protein, partial [Microcystaceae cyanobacterium]